MIADLENLGGSAPDDKPLVHCLPPNSIRKKVLAQIDAAVPRVRTDPSGNVVEINPAFSGLCGFSFSEIKGRKPGSLLQGKDSEASSIAILRDAIKNGTACEAELFNYHKNGTRYRVRIQVVPLRDESGQLSGFEATEMKLA